MSLFLATQKEDKNIPEGTIPTEIWLGINTYIQKHYFTLDSEYDGIKKIPGQRWMCRGPCILMELTHSVEKSSVTRKANVWIARARWTKFQLWVMVTSVIPSNMVFSLLSLS